MLLIGIITKNTKEDILKNVVPDFRSIWNMEVNGRCQL